MSEILSYEKFIENLRGYLLDALNLQEKQIYFEAKDEEGMAPNGDRLFVECRVSSEGKEVCGIHTEELYEDYLDGVSIDKIGDTVTEEIKKLSKAGFFEKTKNVNNYSKVKEDLFIRLLNKKKHEKALENAVYKEVDGIACVLYMKVGQCNGRISSMKIRKDSLVEWGLAENEVYENALLNTYLLTPPRIYQWERLVLNPDYDGEDFMAYGYDNYGMRLCGERVGYCLSTDKRTNGAVAVFLPGVAQKLSEILDDDFYIVFTSIHEAMIHPKSKCYPEGLERILKETIEDATPDEDFLADEIYYYDRCTRKIAKWDKVVSRVTLPVGRVELVPV